MEAENLNGFFPHFELLDLAGDRDGKLVHKHNIPRYLVVGNFSFAEILNVMLGHGLAGFRLYPCAEFFAILDVRDADNVHIGDLLVVVQELLDLPWVDVLTAPEPVDGMDQLDPKKYGVIVEAGWRRGLLLPDLDGVDTAQYQIEICRQKGGIGPNEPVQLYRFEVKRYK